MFTVVRSLWFEKKMKCNIERWMARVNGKEKVMMEDCMVERNDVEEMGKRLRKKRRENDGKVRDGGKRDEEGGRREGRE